MNVLEMFKEWLTVEKGVKLVPDELSNNPSGCIGTVTNENAFLVRILVDDKKALMLILKDDGVVHLYIMDKDASLDEYKRFIDVVNIWLEMNEFSYKLLLTFSDTGRLPRLLSKLSEGSLKELEGDKFVAMLKKLDDKAKIESHAEVVEYELGDLSPSEVVTGLQTIGFKVHDLLHAEDGVIKLIISYKRKLS